MGRVIPGFGHKLCKFSRFGMPFVNTRDRQC